jgi:hypothetical protein
MTVNPTGVNGGGGTTTPVAHQYGPPTGSPGNYGYGGSANPNPTGAPAPTMNPTGGPGAPPVTGPVGNQGGNQSTNQLNSPLGSGLGPQVEAFLQSNGGYNSALTQQAVQAQTQEMQLQANTNYGNLESNLGASGVSPNSSAAALESSNFWSQTTAAENAMTAQEFFNMWQSSMGNEVSVLESAEGPAAQRQAMQYSTPMDDISQGLSIAGSVAGAIAL